MERKLTKLEHCHVQVDVKVDEEAWKKAQEEAFKKVASTVKVDGFRPGKAPVAMLKKKVDQVKVMDEAINSLLPKIYKDILDNEDVKPFAQPSVDVTKLSDTELEVKFVLVVAPEITLGKYKGLSIGKTEAKVTDKDVDEAIAQLQKANGSLIVKEDAAALGDTVVFDFKGTVNGEAFEGGSATNYELELGSKSFVPGFEDQLVGVKAGEHKDVKVTFPTQYVPELAGKDAVFACDVHEVKTKKVAELNDEFVKDLGIKGVETVDALKESKKAELLANKQQSAKNEYLNKLYEAIAKDSKTEIPEEVINNQLESMKKDMDKRLSQSGLTLEQYLQITGQKTEAYEANLKEQAIKNVTVYLMLEKVAEVEKIVIDDAQLDFEMAKIADQYKMTVEDVKKALSNQIEEFRNNVKMNRVEELLLKENN